jgi:hypothetical protein
MIHTPFQGRRRRRHRRQQRGGCALGPDEAKALDVVALVQVLEEHHGQQDTIASSGHAMKLRTQSRQQHEGTLARARDEQNMPPVGA